MIQNAIKGCFLNQLLFCLHLGRIWITKYFLKFDDILIVATAKNTDSESRNTIEKETLYVIHPAESIHELEKITGKTVPAGFRYASNTNTEWLGAQELIDLTSHIEPSMADPLAVNG